MKMWPEPWPIEGLIRRLCQERNLLNLVEPKSDAKGWANREKQLELLSQEVIAHELGSECLHLRKKMKTVLGSDVPEFLSGFTPDISMTFSGALHFCEIKASRVDYNRFDREVNTSFGDILSNQIGHHGDKPWEVEQDILKLHLLGKSLNGVGSCLLLMVDAYTGGGRCWTDIFQSKEVLVGTMCTDFVQSMADRLIAATRIENISADGAKARVIACEVEPWD